VPALFGQALKEHLTRSKLEIGLRRFPKRYWNYLPATALFGVGNSNNALLTLQTQDIGALRSKQDRHIDEFYLILLT
jgi:hypothetical protein